LPPRVAQSLLAPGTTWTDHDGAARAITPNDILVVVPYNAQVSSLPTGLATLGVERVGTVDKFQGQEAPVVIYSCTSSSPEDAPRGISFYDPHRFNVATSRAQGVVIVVASPRLFEWVVQVSRNGENHRGVARLPKMPSTASAIRHSNHEVACLRSQIVT
jgi:hypothetical protein